MATQNPLNDKINIELVKLQDELGALDAAVKHIEKAGEISRDVIEAIQKVQERYDEALKNIEQKYDQYLEKSAEYTKGEIEELAKSHRKQIEEVQQLLDNYLDLAEATAKLPEEINKIDFPVRLDRMEESIKSLNDSLLRTQSNMDELENRLTQKLDQYETINGKIAQNSNQIGTLKGLQITTIGVLIAFILFQILTQIGLIF